MAFNLLRLVFLNIVSIVITSATALNLASCGKGGTGSTYKIGVVVNHNPATWRFYKSNGEQVFYGYDPYVRRINRVSLTASQIQTSTQLSLPAQTDSWFAGPEGKFFFTFDGRILSTLNPDTGVLTTVRTFGGKIVSVAVDADQGLYAFVDEYFATTLLVVNQAGNIESQWTGGPILGDGVIINAGDILPGGKLLVASNAGKMAVIDIRQSIASGAWSFKNLQLEGDEDLNFVGSVPNQANRALVASAKELYLIDVETGAIVDSEVPTAAFVLQKTGRIHLRYLDTAVNRWKFVTVADDGTLKRLELPNSDTLKLSSNVRQLYLTDKYLNLVLDAAAGRQVMTVRLSDALVERTVAVGNGAIIGLGEDGFSAMEASPLGYTSVYSLRTETTKTFKGYNRILLQQ